MSETLQIHYRKRQAFDKPPEIASIDVGYANVSGAVLFSIIVVNLIT
jgi:hypothetical protein